MDNQAIIERFALLAGMTLEEAAKWEDLCIECGLEIEALKKAGVNSETANMILNSTAASLALYRYSMYQSSNSAGDSFTVGDISVSTKSSASVNSDKAREAFEEAKAAAAPYLIDGDFAFKQVRS